MRSLSDDSSLSRAVSPDNSDCEERREEVETVVREPVVICVHKNVSQCHYSLITHYQPTPTQGSRCHHNHGEKERRGLSPAIIYILPPEGGNAPVSPPVFIR